MGRYSGRRQRFIHLVRLAWDLHELGVPVSVDLPPGAEPAVVLPRPAGSLRITASSSAGRWAFTWGRGPGRQVPALASDAARTILAEVAK